MNHTLIVSSGSMALLGEEVICVIARSYVLWIERWDDRTVLKYLGRCGVSMRREKMRNVSERFN